MPYTVLKISKILDNQTEVAGEFADESEAHNYIQDSQLDDLNDEHEYQIEVPPSQAL